jgi:hypothetical protein
MNHKNTKIEVGDMQQCRMLVRSSKQIKNRT